MFVVHFIGFLLCIVYCILCSFDVTGWPSSSQPDEVIRSVNREAVVGSEAIIECCLPYISSVVWAYSSKSNAKEDELITNGKVQPGFEQKLRLDTSIAGCHNLVINYASVEDSGIYKCIDENGDPERPYVTVLDVRERQSAESSKHSPRPENVSYLADSDRSSLRTGPSWIIIFAFVILGLVATMLLLCIICLLVKFNEVRDSLKQHFGCNTDGQGEAQMHGETSANNNNPHDVEIALTAIEHRDIIHEYPRQSNDERMKLLARNDVRKYEICELPIELQEIFLICAYMLLYRADFSIHFCVPSGEKTAFQLLSSVTSVWWNTLRGWPQSETKRWLKHKLQRLVRSKCQPLRRRFRTTALKTSEQNLQVVIAVTWMNGYVYAVCNRSEYICVWNGDSLLPPIHMRGLGQPTDIAACCEVNALYVSDSKRSIRRAMLIGGSCSLLIKLDEMPKALSVRSSKLLVCMQKSNILKCFARDGHAVGELKLPDGIEPLHAIETFHATVVVCHEVTAGNHVISEFNLDGSHVRSFGVPDGIDILKPCHMSLGNDGDIFTVDSEGRQLFLLSTDLKLKRILVKTDVVPTRVCVSRSAAGDAMCYVAGFASCIHEIPLTKSKATPY